MSDFNQDQSKVMEKIKKLLALGESPSQAESESAMIKAHELLKQYNLSLSDLEVEDSEVIDEVYTAMGRSQGWKIHLIIGITKANFCGVYTKTKPVNVGYSGRLITSKTYQFVGKPYNVAVAKAMADYLFSTIDRMATETHKGDGRAVIESYKSGIADTLYMRLESLRKKDIIESVESRALVVAEDKVVKDYLDNLDLKKNRTTRTSPNNWTAYQEGRDHGNRISLNDQVGGSAQKQLGSK